jgi:tetratricopeptide (TPR) repeat protein
MAAVPIRRNQKGCSTLSSGKPGVEQGRTWGWWEDSSTELSVSSAVAEIDLSYRGLEETAARVFRLVPVNPGPDVSTAAVAVLVDLPISEVLPALATLTQARLIDVVADGAGRWRMRDLVCQYARQLSDAWAGTDGREQAWDRLLGYYLNTAEAADDHLRGLPEMVLPREFSSRHSALAWFDTERSSLIAAVQLAADTGRDQAAMSLPLLMAQYFAWRRRFDDLLAATTISLNAAQRLGDMEGEGDALNNLGLALGGMRRFDEAVTAQQDAALVFREAGDRHGEGDALGNLGLALGGMRRFDEAVTAHQDAAAIYRETGDRHGEGKALNNLGLALGGMRRFDEAVTAHQDAAAIYRETGDRHGEGNALGNLGLALRKSGRSEEAISVLRDAVIIFRETGDLHSQGAALNNLGSTQQEDGRFEEAMNAHEEAAVIFQKVGDREREGVALEYLGRAQAAARLE